jgi:hypothetical protein
LTSGLHGKRRANESSCTWISHFTKLEMKISDIEFQGDGSKARFTTRQMTELILDFWLRISPKNSVLESKWNKLVFVKQLV